MPPKSKTKIPAARIKRIMRTDEEVGKVASITPVLIAKAVESFLKALVEASVKETMAKDAKKVSVSHLKKAVEENAMFDFLLEKVENVKDGTEEKSKKRKEST